MLSPASAHAAGGQAEPALAARAIADLREDLDELLFVAHRARVRLRSVTLEVEAVGADLHPATLAVLSEQLGAARARLRSLCDGLRRARRHGGVAQLRVAKESAAELLRVEQALLGTLTTAADWQSPSFLHSLRAAAGRQAGRVAPHWNDYKRDRHLDAAEYERAYVRDLVDGPTDLRALLTGCGMAAFTTIVASMLMERGLMGPVAVGRALYHESKEVLTRILPGAVREVDERDTGGMVRALGTLRPRAIFLDTLCNTRWAPVPDVQAVLDALRGQDAVVVLDNTALSASFQPFELLREADRPHLIVFESLLKYAQLGFDRTNAGMIVARGALAAALEHHREHLGTNVGDAAVNTLPQPSRRVLERRLGRLGRNAALLAERLAAEAVGRGELRVVHPGLPDHPSHGVARRLTFRGGCLGIASTPERERRFVAAALAEARRRGLPLIGGSSFGFDTTRVYLTAASTGHGEPFVRIAAGTEDRLALERLADALAAALREALK